MCVLDLHSTNPRFVLMAGRKRSHCFAITLNHVDYDKTCLGEYWRCGDLIDRFACGEEHYNPPLDPLTGEADDVVGRHHHIFVEFVDGYFLDEVRDMVVEFYGGDNGVSVDIQCCKSPKAWLVYLSKEDYCPYLYNIRISELSFYARANHYVKTNYRVVRPIDRADAFIVNAGQNARFVIGLIEKRLCELRTISAGARVIYEPNRRCSLVQEVLASVEHLYIEGSPGYGKTELVDYVTQRQKVFKCGEPNYFMFGMLDEDIDVIWFEDFDSMKFKPYMSTILSLLDHKPVTVSKKHENDRTITFQGRVIFTSNYAIGLEFPMLKRRVKEIYTIHKMFECLGCVGDYVPVQDLLNFNVGTGDIDADIEERVMIDGAPSFLTSEEVERFFDSL